MPHADFVHLRVHSAYSLSAGAIRVKDLAKLCQKQKMPAVAITDTGNLFGALEFATATGEAGVQPIVGCEVPIRRVDEQKARNGLMLPPDRLVLLVQNERGYQNLLKLVSRAYLGTEGAEDPQVELAALEGFS